jgi:hypothetical protein
MMQNAGDQAQLADLLGEALQKLRTRSFDDTWSHLSLAQFSDLLSVSRAEISQNSLPASRAADLWHAFAPTSDWDDTVGDVELGNTIFELIEALYGRPE